MDSWERVETEGFAVVPKVLTADEVRALCEATANLRDEGRRGGVRNLLARCPEVRALAQSAPIRNLVEPVLGPAAFAARGILFDKTPDANWKVPWHQDLTIAVEGRLEVAGYGPWSVKDGVQHVQPPAAVLEGMLAVRIHLDDCGADNGPLRVIPGSHREGRLSDEQVLRWQESVPPVLCMVDKGGVLLMRPLLLHASSPAASPAHRRVIHIEFASCRLPEGLQWQVHERC